MKNVNFIILTAFILLANSGFSQSIRLTEDTTNVGIEIFLMPGINPKGTRLFQFSFKSIDQFNENLNSRIVSVMTVFGKTITLENPNKDTTYQSIDSTTSWFSSFALSKDQIEILKSERISGIAIFLGNTTRTVSIPVSKSAEISDIIKKHF